MKELITKSAIELNKALGEKRESLRAFRFGIIGSKNRNVREGRGIKREISKILTAINLK
jgi:ribosomal protein L29